MKNTLLSLLLPILPLSVGTAVAQTAPPPFEGQVLYGINRDTGELMRHDFDKSDTMRMGLVAENGMTLEEIDAAAYVPGMATMTAFSFDLEDNASQLHHVYLANAEVEKTLEIEGGKVTGAVAVQGADGVWRTFGVQAAKATDPFTVTGLANLNPNNRDDMEFLLITPNGMRITRDDLHRDGEGYDGEAAFIRFRPKGNGNQNGLVINGEPYPLQNSNTYMLQSGTTIPMQVEVYNDHVENGKAMGHWWLKITSGTAHFADDIAVEFPDRLVEVNPDDGTVTELMPLSRSYDGLSTTDGVTFLATAGNQLYRIDPANEREALVGLMSDDNVLALEHSGQILTGFELDGDRLTPIDATTGEPLDSSIYIDCRDLGTAFYVHRDLDPAMPPCGYD